MKTNTPAPLYTLIDLYNLYVQEGSSDKIYQVGFYQHNISKKYQAVFAWGRRSNALHGIFQQHEVIENESLSEVYDAAQKKVSVKQRKSGYKRGAAAPYIMLPLGIVDRADKPRFFTQTVEAPSAALDL